MQKVLEQYNYLISFQLRSPRTSFFVPKVTNEVLEFMSVEKIIKRSIHASELRDRLLLDGVVDANDLPSASQINKRMRRDLVMSKKKLSSYTVRKQNSVTNSQTRWVSQCHFYILTTPNPLLWWRKSHKNNWKSQLRKRYCWWESNKSFNDTLRTQILLSTCSTHFLA